MKTRRKSLFLVILAGVLASGLAIAATPDSDNVVAGRGWDIGICRVPNYGTNSPSTASPLTTPVSFVNGEIINMPLHINNLNDSPDNIDISISGSPIFLWKVEMGESRYTSGGIDKYSSVMSVFQGGIDFDQPDAKITDEAAVQSTINRFRDSTASAYRFTPVGRAKITPSQTGDPCAAVQLQFYVDANGTGKVRIFPNCTVVHYRRSSSYSTWDYKTVPGSGNSSFQKYDIYAYHYFDPNDGNNKTVNITDTYVDQNTGGQIYVNGNVIIGGDSNSTIDPCNFGNQLVKGKITVVATGNIWIADSIYVQGNHDASGMPTSDNPNVLGLIAQGVIKVVDPGMSSYGNASYGYPASPDIHLLFTSAGLHSASAVGVNDSVYGATHKHFYCPIGNRKATGDANNVRCLPHYVVVEAALTVGGGGWGAENVATGSTSSNPNRKEYVLGTQDNLIVHGAISEVLRGVVGMPSYNDGFLKEYDYDKRLLTASFVGSEKIPGDLNGDYKVDYDDVTIMAAHWIEKGYVRFYSYTLDTSPNWTTQGQWVFGHPTGSGGTENSNPDPNSGYTGSNVYGVNLSGDYTIAVGGPYYLTAGPFNCRQFYNIKLKFARWLNTDEPNYVACKIEDSNDGTNWNTLWENTGAVTDSSWQVVEYDVSATADNEATVYFRWSYQIISDRAYPYSGWNIDDIEILGKL